MSILEIKQRSSNKIWSVGLVAYEAPLIKELKVWLHALVATWPLGRHLPIHAVWLRFLSRSSFTIYPQELLSHAGPPTHGKVYDSSNSVLVIDALLTVAARLVLNFKQLEYTTKWVEYPDVKPLIEAQ